MRSFFAAISLLSILPVGKFCPSEKDLRDAVNYFPLAGLVFGIVFYFVALGLIKYDASLVVAMILTLLPEVLTKGFHLDGLADTADGLLSGRSRERKLEIMRDSHIGTMGVGAIFAVLGLKFALFTTLPFEMLPVAVGVMMLSGRVNIVYYIAMSKYARAEGLGKLLFLSTPVAGMILGGIVMIVAVYFVLGLAAELLILFLLLGAFLWSRITHHVIGGATGDTIGCFEELSELLVLFFLVGYLD